MWVAHPLSILTKGGVWITSEVWVETNMLNYPETEGSIDFLSA